jgi:hypothetical protein
VAPAQIGNYRPSGDYLDGPADAAWTNRPTNTPVHPNTRWEEWLSWSQCGRWTIYQNLDENFEIEGSKFDRFRSCIWNFLDSQSRNLVQICNSDSSSTHIGHRLRGVGREDPQDGGCTLFESGENSELEGQMWNWYDHVVARSPGPVGYSSK